MEKEEIKEQIVCYKEHASLINTGEYFRLSDPFHADYAAWMFVSEQKEEAFVSVVMLKIHGNMTVNYVRMKGLKPDAVYEVDGNKERFYGSALMEAGIPMPIHTTEYPAYQIYLKAVGNKEGILWKDGEKNE